MNQTQKAILAVALLVIAGGIFAWRFSSREAPPAIVVDNALQTEGTQALEAIFSSAASKKWTDASLWLTPRAAQTYAATAEKIFTASPSMDGIKVLDFGTDYENNNATFLLLQVPTTEVAISIQMNKNKAGKMLLDSVTETALKAKDYKKPF